MSNIYLRLPISRCQFFRNRDDKRPQSPHEPIELNVYTPEHFAIRNSLTNASSVTQEVNMQCFSQQQWQNMMNGRSPLGGNSIFKRDKNLYLTYDEVQKLCGKTGSDKSFNEDYLCIKLPREVECVDVVRSVTSTWNLDVHGVRQLSTLLNNQFKRSIVEWIMATFDYCTSNKRVICRSNSALLERFMMRYGIEITPTETDNMRRIIARWISTEHINFKAYSCFDMRYVDSQEKEVYINGIQWL